MIGSEYELVFWLTAALVFLAGLGAALVFGKRDDTQDGGDDW